MLDRVAFPRRGGLRWLVVALVLLVKSVSAFAAADLSISPLTWNIIGLDSNNVNVGPNHFPIGARVCNIGDAPATNVVSAFIWDSANALIDLRPGTFTDFNSTPVPSLAPADCYDFYYEVEVTRDAAAYDTTRRYHITATADGLGTVSTPTPRELYVEHLVSQSRNHILDVQLDGTSIPNGGTMALLVGQTYTIDLVGSTATNGYEQIESFINFPNTIFQVLSVSTTYTADTSLYVDNPDDMLYGDACLWENDPNNPYYRSCRDVGKAGGGVTVSYVVKILQTPNAPLVNPEPISTLIYDFSGSSYHYNADFDISARFAAIVDPTTVTIAKSFSPDPTNVGGVSALTFTITNPNPVAVSGVSFSDVFPTSPGAMVVASPTGATTNGCGAATFAPVAGAGSLSFSNGTVAANSSCTVKVHVTVPATGTYTNTSSNLFADGIDTGNFATDTLTVNTAPPSPTPVCGSTLAVWNFPTGFSVTSPAPDIDNAPGTPSAQPGDGITSTAFTEGSDSWGSNGDVTTGTTLVFANEEYVEFAVDTSGYTGLDLSFAAARKNTPNSPQGIAVYAGTTSLATDGVEGNGSASDPGTVVVSDSTALPLSTTAFSSFGPLALPDGTTHVRIYFFNSGNTSPGSDAFVDNVTITGCVLPSPPTIGKSFSPDPVTVGDSSTLTFTLSNPNATLALSGIAFDDTLPAGVTVASGSSAQCGGTLTSTAPNSLSFTGGTLAAGGSCTVSTTVTVTTAGPHDNVSGFVSSTEGGTNSGTSGIATDSILAILPPGIDKQFAPNPVLVGAVTTLTFTLTNPNADTALTGVVFTDTFPPGVQVWTTPNATVSGCGTPTFAPAASDTTVSFSGGTIAASGTCTVTVTVTATATGDKVNTTDAVSSTNGGTGNSGTDTLTVIPPTPAIALLKQVGPTASGPWSSFLAVSVGGDVFYRFTVENIGNAPLFSVGVSDPQISTASCSWPSPLPVASPTDDPTASCVVGPIAAVAGTNPNTATASGTNGTTVTDTSTATYVTTGLTIGKSVTEANFSAVGQVLHYSFLVTNNGFLALTGPITVADDKSSDESCPAVTTVGNADSSLDPGEMITCTATYTVTQADLDAGSVTNVASASAMFFGSTVTSPTDTETVTAVQSPALTQTKVGVLDMTVVAPTNQANVGDEIDYTITASNGSNVTLTNVTVADPLLLTLSCSPAQPATLAPGAALTCTGSYTLLQTDINAGSRANTATADSDQTPPTTTPNTVPLPQSPALTLVKTATPQTYSAVNAVIGYSYLVTNSGNVTLSGPFTVSDDKTTNESCPATASLAPGASLTCTASYTITQADLNAGSVTNVASATNGTVTSPSDTETVTAVQSPALTQTKVGVLDMTVVTPTNQANVGDTINYTITATNSGNVTLTGVTVVDSLLGTLSCAPVQPATLAPGAALTCTGSYTLLQTDINAGSRANTATADSNETPPTTTPNTVPIPSSPALTQTKVGVLDMTVVAPTNQANVGDTINYTITATNSGNVTLTNVTVVDPLLGTLSCAPVQPATLAPGAALTCTGSYTLLQTDLNAGSRANTATADSDQTPPTMTPNTVPIPSSPALTMVKTATPQTYSAVNAVISYSYVVTNSGNVTLSGPFTVSDDKATDESCPATASLAPGASITCTASYTITQADLNAGSVTNVASASGAFNGNPVTSPTDTETVTSTATPALTVVKTATPQTYNAVNAVINYSYVVTNSGNVTLSGPFTVSDDKVTNESCPATASLAPGASITCTASYTITQADVNAGAVTNIAAAAGFFGATPVTSPTDTETVTAVQTPALTQTKVGVLDMTVITPPNQANVGDKINYTLTATNSGNVTLTNVTVVDPLLGALSCAPAQPATLAPGAAITCTASYTLVQADINAGSRANTATADSDQTPPTETPNTVPLPQTPALSIVKTATPTTYNAVNAIINYSYLVTNSGNVTLSGPFTVTDDKATATCPATASLAPGASITCTASYTITQADLNAGSVTNVASASGAFNGNPVISPTDTETVTAVQTPGLTMVKTASPQTYNTVNAVIGYSYVVTNSGNVTLTGPFTVTDDKATASCPAPNSLAPGASLTCTASYTITQADLNTGSVTNVASAHGAFNGNPVVSNTDTETVTAVQTPALTIMKTATPQTYSALNAIISYSYVVTNSGNVTLTGPFTVSDDKATATCPATASLAPGANITCTASYTITQADINAGSVTNVAAASGAFNGNPVVSPPDSETVTAVQTPALTQTKAGVLDMTAITPTNRADVGDKINYTITATNSGNIALTNVTVVDPLLGVLSCGPAQPAALPVGASIICTGSYTLVQADLDAGSRANTATADSDQTPPTVTPNTVPLPNVGAPGLEISKSANPLTAAPYEPVTYSYPVCTTGQITLFDVHVTDDNGTPDFTGDDFTVGDLASLAPGACKDLAATVIPVISTDGIVNGGAANGAIVNAGAVIVATSLANGDIKATYRQDFAINDNTYGTGAIGWPASNRHTFSHLTASDKLEFRFFDKNGTKVLDFYVDTLSAASKVRVPGTGKTINYPSGYGTLGPFGGDGRIVSGNRNNIVSFSTAISDNLNNPLNLPNKAALIVNSPTTLVGENIVVDSLMAPGGWDSINTFTVVIKGSTFPTGFGSVTIPDQHNSPNKFLAANSIIPVPIDSTVVNTATATANTIAAGTVSATATAAVSVVVPSLPSPWQTADIGLVQAKGSASYAGGTFTVTGSGRDIGVQADEFRSVYQLASGDASVVARVTSIQNTDLFAKAAVMIRDSLNDNAPEANIAVTPGRGIVFSYRTATGGNTIKSVKTGLKAPYWVKMARNGNTFTASYSSDGVAWRVLGTKIITMGPAPYIGMGVTSVKDGTVATATFDNVTATP